MPLGFGPAEHALAATSDGAFAVGMGSTVGTTTPTTIREFLAFGGGFTGGAFVAAGDVDGDGRADVIVGSDSGATSIAVRH